MARQKLEKSYFQVKEDIYWSDILTLFFLLFHFTLEGGGVKGEDV